MRRIEIEPFDVLLFRDGRPFGVADAAGNAAGVFPPPPSALYGALRTAAFRTHGGRLVAGGPPVVPPELLASWGNADQHGTARVCGSALVGHDAATLWPAPAPLFLPKARGENRSMARAVPSIVRFASSLEPGLRICWIDEPGVFEPAGGFLTCAGLSAYLSGGIPSPDQHRADADVSVREDRSGIALDPGRRTVRTGALFTQGFRRLSGGVRIAVWIEGDTQHPLPDQGLLRLGQDGRPARYTARPAGPDDWPSTPRSDGARVLLYLATPARFEHGWLPSWIDPRTLAVKDLSANLVTACIERPQMLGGWDLARNRPRVLHRLVRAGSVFFFECASAKDARAMAGKFHGTCISEPAGDERPPEAAPQAGFGLCFVGVW